MKIIQGSLKRKTIKVPLNIRPTSFRLKKAIFDFLGEEVGGRRVLDLFAGSGALGIESLSLGAKEVVFVDIKKSCIKVIQENIISLRQISSAQLILKDCIKAVKDFNNKNEKFDFIFLDPPYHSNLLIKTLQIIDEYDIVADSGYIVVLTFKTQNSPLKYTNFSLLWEKSYGQSKLMVYQKFVR